MLLANVVSELVSGSQAYACMDNFRFELILVENL